MRLRLLPQQVSLNTWQVWPLRNAAFWATCPFDVYGANAWHKWGWERHAMVPNTLHFKPETLLGRSQ